MRITAEQMRELEMQSARALAAVMGGLGGS